MKKIILLTICFIMAVLGGCRNIFTGNSQGHNSGGSLPDGYGALRVSFARGAARTAMPNGALENFELGFFFNDLEEPQSEEHDGDTYTFTLPAGEYRLEVKAWNKTAPARTELVAEGKAEIKIIRAAHVPFTLTLNPVVSDGTGTLIFTLIHENPDQAAIDPVAFTLSPIFDGGKIIDLLEWEKKPKHDKIEMNTEYSARVPAGYYLLSVTLLKTLENPVQFISNSFANQSEVVHIYRNMDTIIENNFTNIQFIENVVINTLDYTQDETEIPGSLRYAIDRASKRGIKSAVRVMLPQGSEIKLKSSLAFESPDVIVIEGNGIILSKSAEPWENMSRLMTIHTEAAISRVHFKDSAYGAIANYENLTLASCIFSNNTSEDSGGAIENTGTLAVKACTFYDNRADKGGAIFNNANGIIYLTGNLFFGNTDLDGLAISVESDNYDNIYSGGYNVVCLADNSGPGAFDWMGPYDTRLTLTDPPFSTKTFRLFSGNEVTKITIGGVLPEGYPNKDFYGEILTAPVYSGAVQGITD